MPNSRAELGLSLTSFRRCRMVFSQCNGVPDASIPRCSTQKTNGQILCSLSSFARQRLQRTDFIFIFLMRELKLDNLPKVPAS